MHVLRGCALAVGSLGLVTLSALPAQAAEISPAAGEIAAGYSYIYDSNSSTGMPAGWFLSAGASLNETFSVVGDISGNYKSESVVGVGGTASVSTSVHAFLAGPRVSGRVSSGQMSFYGQFLIGAARASGTATVNVGGTSSAISPPADTEFCLAPGAGVDIALSDTSAIRAAVNERLIRANGNISKEFQFQLGLVYRFGR
jgi:hypothetical protein